MSMYLYKSYDKEGKRYCGSMRAKTREAVKSDAEARGLHSITVYKTDTVYARKAEKLVPPKELAIFCRQMSVMFHSQITLMEGVELMSRQTGNKHLRTALGEIYRFMEQSLTFAEAMAMYPHIFGGYLLSMINIGEVSGSLDTVFSRMAAYFEKSDKVSRKIRSAVAYPVVLTALMAAIVVFLVVKILPMFANLLSSMGADANGFTGVILAISGFTIRYGWIILGAIALIVILILWFSHTNSGRAWLDKVKLRIGFSRFIYARILTSRLARSMAILLKSGVQLLNVLDESKQIIGNRHVELKFEAAISEVRAGTDMGEALGRMGLFPELFIRMNIIGQRAGRLEEMLERSADIFDEEVDQSVDRLTTLIEPILIIILSVIVGVILVSVMLPMINIMSAID